ncbi:MAG: hypothetical protein ABI655_13225 [Phenylobacterium sp.]
MRPLRRSLLAGGLYFVAMLAAGWLFGPLREAVVRSGLDPLLAVLLEAPAMLLVMVFACGLAVRQLHVPARAGDRLVMGATAIALVLAAEVAGGAAMRGWTLRDFLGEFATARGGVFAATLLAGLLMPLIQLRLRRERA